MTLHPIPSQRHRFAIPDDVHYLNCAYMSPIADTVRDALAAGNVRKDQPWTYKPADFFGYGEAFRDRAGRIMGADPNCIAIIPSASYGLAVAASNLPLKSGQRIVILDDQFPSNVYVWRKCTHETGAEIVTARRDPSADWNDAVLDAITVNTAIVSVPHCHWIDGRIVDLVAVGKACRAVGAALVLDLTQSLGAMPFDLAQVQPDFAIAACYKWLMGPYSLGMMYAAPKYHEGSPIEHNWLNRAGSEDFTQLVNYRDDFQPGARRFDMGEMANPGPLAGASAAIDMLLEWGVDAIAETLGTKTHAIAAAVQDVGISTVPIGIRASHFLALSFDAGVPPQLMTRLAERNVHVSQRGSTLRVTPHVYNNERDANRLIAALRS